MVEINIFFKNSLKALKKLWSKVGWPTMIFQWALEDEEDSAAEEDAAAEDETIYGSNSQIPQPRTLVNGTEPHWLEATLYFPQGFCRKL